MEWGRETERNRVVRGMKLAIGDSNTQGVLGTTGWPDLSGSEDWVNLGLGTTTVKWWYQHPGRFPSEGAEVCTVMLGSVDAYKFSIDPIEWSLYYRSIAQRCKNAGADSVFFIGNPPQARLGVSDEGLAATNAKLGVLREIQLDICEKVEWISCEISIGDFGIDTHLMKDQLHLTQAAQRELQNRVLTAVPEPSSLALAAVVILSVLVWKFIKTTTDGEG